MKTNRYACVNCGKIKELRQYSKKASSFVMTQCTDCTKAPRIYQDKHILISKENLSSLEEKLKSAAKLVDLVKSKLKEG